MRWLIGAALGAVGWWFLVEAMKESTKPRGIRNNNPLNIERTGERWLGLADDQSADERFCIFISPEYGIRAGALLLNNYQRLHGINTIRGMLHRFAPNTENNTAAYVQHIADACGVYPDTPITIRDYLPAMIPAMIRHENGQQPYTAEQIALGIQMAGLWNE